MSPVNTRNRTFFSYIINLNCIIPTSWSKNIWIWSIKSNTKNSIRVPTKLSIVFHFKYNWFSLFIIETDIFIFTSSSQKTSIWIVVNSIKLIFRIIFTVHLMKTPSRSCMPMLKISISLCTYKNISCFYVRCCRSPPKWSHWHIVTLSVLVNMTAQGKCALGCLCIINSNRSISKSTS